MKQYLNKRWVRILAGSVLAVAAYGVAGHWLLPWWLESFIPKKVQVLTGRKAQIARIDINPFTLEAKVSGFKLMGPDGGKPAVDIASLYANLSAASIIDRAVVVDEIRVRKPHLSFARVGPNRYSFADVLERFAKAPKEPESSKSEPLHFALYNIQLQDGQVDFDDRAAGREHRISQLNFGLPFISNLAHKVSVFVKPNLSAHVDGSILQVDGRSKPFAKNRTTRFDLNLEALDIPAYMGLVPVELPYVPTSGKLNSKLVFSFSQSDDGTPYLGLKGQTSLSDVTVMPRNQAATIKVSGISVQLDDSELLAQRIKLAQLAVHKLVVALKGQEKAALDVDNVELKDVSYAGEHKQLQIASLNISAPQASLNRDKQGNIDLLSALMPPSGKTAPQGKARAAANDDEALAKPAPVDVDSASKTDTPKDGAGAEAAQVGQGASRAAPSAQHDGAQTPASGQSIAGDFRATLDAFKLSGGRLRFTDAGTGAPVKITLEDLQVSAKNATTRKGASIPVSLSAKQGKGKFALNGDVVLEPLQVRLNTNIKGFDLAPAQGYFASMLNVDVQRMELGTQGKLELSHGKDNAWKVDYQGDVGVAHLAVRDKLTGQPFLDWRSLQVRKLALQYPAKGAPFALSTGAIALSDFYARIILNSNARLNVQDVVAGAGAPVSVTSPTQAKGKPKAKSPTKEQSAEKPAASGPSPRIELGRIQLAKGRVSYTDNYIEPHYSARMLDLDGSIGAVSSAKPAPAPVDLEGKLDSGGTLAVKGKINPLVKPLYLDLGADAKGIELPRLSPYSAKYAGYDIDKGKLSVNVHYKLQNQQLQAKNHVFLDQLTFGDHVDSPDATELPVRLAVALLKNSKGEININMPISGSLSDPEFSIGPALLGAFTNLIGKALTSPFALLGAVIGGGGEKLSYVEFKPGYATLSDATKTKLDQLAKALKDRPALKMDIAGRADPATDPAGLRHARLMHQLKLEKIKDDGFMPADADRVSLSKDEYNEYLKDLYDDAEFDKPKNFIGFTKSQPPEKMEQMLIAHIKLSDDALQQLADARAQTVLDYLTTQKKVAGDRLFLTAPHLNTKGITDKGGPNRVDFSLK